MRLTVLGNADRYLAPLSAGSSYLVETKGGTRLLLDAGGGAREALAARGAPSLDALVISHFHFDHVQDLPQVRDLLAPRAPLALPPGEARRLDALAQAYVFEGAFEANVVEALAPLQVGDARLAFAPTRHSAPSVATRVEADGRSLVYASDTAPCAALVALARGADLLVMHTLLPDVEQSAAHARIHATARSAGALAAEAGVGRLILSHRFHGSTDQTMREEATRASCDVTLARSGAVVDL